MRYKIKAKHPSGDTNSFYLTCQNVETAREQAQAYIDQKADAPSIYGYQIEVVKEPITG